MEPLVSILIPAYNAELWIAETMKSAISQTWRKTEIIVVDDGSKDRTLAVAKQFESAKVRVLTQANAGATAARNKALSVCQGDFIQWLDADDLLAPDKIATQMAAYQRLGNRRLLFSASWGSFMYRTRTAKFSPTALWRDLSPVEWLCLQMEQNLHMQTATWLVSRDLTQAAGIWDPRLASCASDDGEYFCRVILGSEGTRFVPESKVFYRMPTSKNLSYIGLSEKKMETQLLALQLYIGHVRAREDSERVRTAGVNFLQNWLHNFYPHRSDLVERANHVAHDLGGTLKVPNLSWKYEWVRRVFGWGTAKQASRLAPQLRWSAVRAWDKALFTLESRRELKNWH